MLLCRTTAIEKEEEEMKNTTKEEEERKRGEKTLSENTFHEGIFRKACSRSLFWKVYSKNIIPNSLFYTAFHAF